MKTRKLTTLLAINLAFIAIAAAVLATARISGRNEREADITIIDTNTDTTSIQAPMFPDEPGPGAEVFTENGKTYVVGTADEVKRFLGENDIKDYQGLFFVTGKYDKTYCREFEPLDWKRLAKLRREHPEGIPNKTTAGRHNANPSQLHYAVIDIR